MSNNPWYKNLNLECICNTETDLLFIYCADFLPLSDSNINLHTDNFGEYFKQYDKVKV